MKKTLLMMTAFACTLCLHAQNIQLHYDLGHTLYGDLEGRPNLTTTFEMFKTDQLGSTFLFTDIDYFTDGAAGAYWEISREFNLTSNKRVAAHIEYDGGVSSIENTAIATRFQHAALVGGAYNYATADYNTTLSLQMMYKRYFKGQSRGGFNSYQITGIWSTGLLSKAVTFSGFVDVWHDNSVNGNLIVVGEPQLWYNVNTLNGCEKINLSVGTEIEVSNNFVFNKRGENNRFYAIPTLAAKWTF